GLLQAAAGKTAFALGVLGDAERELGLAVGAARELQFLPIVASCLLDLADIALVRADAGAAEHWLERAQALSPQLHSRWLAGAIGGRRGRAARRRGDLDAARSLCHGALATQTEAGYRLDVIATLETVAALELDRGAARAAARIFGALRSAREQLEVRL